MYPSDIFVDGIVFLVLRDKYIVSNDCLYLSHPHYDPVTVNRTYLSESIAATCGDVTDYLPVTAPNPLRIVVVSDTHNKHVRVGSIPDSDVFVHCGDVLLIGKHYSERAIRRKLTHFNQWLSKIPAQMKIVIAGNHDTHLESLGKSKVQSILSNATYLVNECITYEQYTIYASPISTGHSPNKAFQSQAFLQQALSEAPENVDVLITHGQCPELQSKVRHKIHLWGHNHNSYGVRYAGDTCQNQPVSALSICAPLMDGRFQLRNLPIVLDVPRNPADIVCPTFQEMTLQCDANNVVAVVDERNGGNGKVEGFVAVTPRMFHYIRHSMRLGKITRTTIETASTSGHSSHSNDGIISSEVGNPDTTTDQLIQPQQPSPSIQPPHPQHNADKHDELTTRHNSDGCGDSMWRVVFTGSFELRWRGNTARRKYHPKQVAPAS